MAVGEETCGVISMCNNETAQECFALNLFGNSSTRHFESVKDDTTLFLYNYSSKLLYGTWRRTAEPSWNPGSTIYGGLFSAHLPVERVCEYPPIPLAGKAADVLNCTLTMVFDPFLTRQQVTDLCALFEESKGAQQNPATAEQTAPAAEEATAAQSPVIGLLADADATVTAMPCGTAERVSPVQEKLAAARALTGNPDTPGHTSLRESAACLFQAMEAVRESQASMPPNGAAPAAAAPQPEFLPVGRAIPVSPLEEGQICPSFVTPGLAARLDSSRSAQDSLPSTPHADSNGHANDGVIQQPTRGLSLAGAFDNALLDVLRTPAGGQAKKMRKKKKRRGMPVDASSGLEADVARQASLQEPGSMAGALVCGCTGEKLDEYYAAHRFLVPPSLASARQRIPQGLPVFLFNNDARLLLGPFYAKETPTTNSWVEVEEREPPLVVQEKELLDLLQAEPSQRSDQGYNVTGAAAAELLSRFAKAAVPMRAQPYRFLATELGGVVFTCSKATIRECLERQLFGMMQDAFVPIVQHIRPGLPVFLFNHSSRVLLGPFSAASHGAMCIEPKAWGHRGHATPFPAQVRVVPHEPVVSISELEYKPLIERTCYYGPSAFHFDLTREEVDVLLGLLAMRRPFGASQPYLAPMCWRPANPPAGPPALYFANSTTHQQGGSAPAPNGPLLAGLSGGISAAQPSGQQPANPAGEPFRFRGQPPQFGLAPSVRLPPAQQHFAPQQPQDPSSRSFAAANGALQGWPLGMTSAGIGQAATVSAAAGPTGWGWGSAGQGPQASEQPASARRLYGTQTGDAGAHGAAAASGALRPAPELANGAPPAKRHRLANMAGTDDPPAAGGTNPGEPAGQAAPPTSMGSQPNGPPQSVWSGWASPAQSAQAPGGVSGPSAQPQPASLSPFAVFAQANKPVSQPAPVPFPGFAQPSAAAAAAPQANASAQPPCSWPSPGRLQFPPALQPPARPITLQAPAQPITLQPPPQPITLQPSAQLPASLSTEGQTAPGNQQRPAPSWPQAGNGARQNGMQAGAPPVQQHSHQHGTPQQQQQQQPVGNIMDSINALPHALGAIPTATLEQQPQLAAVIRAALGATAQLQDALQAILAVLQPHAAAPAAAPEVPPPDAGVQVAPSSHNVTPAPVPFAPFPHQPAPAPVPVEPSPHHATPVPGPPPFSPAQQPAQAPSGAWTGFHTPGAYQQHTPQPGAFMAAPDPSGQPPADGAAEWPPAAPPHFAGAPSGGMAAANAAGGRVPPFVTPEQAFGSPYTPTNPGSSSFRRPPDATVPAAPAFGFAAPHAAFQQQQQQQHQMPAFTFRGAQPAGELPSYVAGVGEPDAQQKPAAGKMAVSMRIRQPKSVKKKRKAAQKRPDTPASTRKALKQELRELAAEQAEADGRANAAVPARRATPKARNNAERTTPKSKTKGSTKKAAAVGALSRQLRSAAQGIAHDEHKAAGAKRKREADEEEHRTMVVFDTNVFMGSAKDRNIIMECFRTWRSMDPQIHILLPRTVVNELKTIALSHADARAKHDAMLGLMVVNVLINFPTCRVQMPSELPAGRVSERLKDDGILDCLLHFTAKGHKVLLCTSDKQFITRAQAQGLDAIKPALLRNNHKYPAHESATPKAAKKKRKQAPST